MKIHEYQAKDLFKAAGVSTPQGAVAKNVQDARKIADGLGYPCVVKAQVHVGGRGKAGAIKVVKEADQFDSTCQAIIGMDVKGLTVETVLIEQGMDIQQEFYVGLTVDRALRDNVLMVSAEGGVDIEEVSANNPEKILVKPLNYQSELSLELLEEVVQFLKLNDEQKEPLKDILQKLAKAYFDNDAQLAEINPLAWVAPGQWMACDGKVLIDDNALFRHEDLAALQEEEEDNELEKQAHQQGIAYVKLPGNVGIIGNGAGLVMTTMDEVKRAGGEPANFLDIGGGAKKEVMEKCLHTIYADSEVQGIFINIFGGITRCDEVAKGVMEVTANAPRQLPIVIRLSGTNAKEGRAVIEGCDYLVSAETMSEGAQKIVERINV